MAGFGLRLLGVPELYREGPLVLPTRKLWAITAYLAAQAEPVQRGKLAALLWGDQEEERARANLRQELYRLRGTSAEGLFISQGDTLTLAEHHSDLETVSQYTQQGQWGQALALFRGEFAQGLVVRGAAEFEDWLLLEREHWQGLWKEAARNQAQNLEASAPHEALKLYQQIVQAEPFQEDLQRALISLTARLDGPPAALKLYEQYKSRLSKEFSLQPLGETQDLIERIRSGRASLGPPSQGYPTPPSSLEHPALVGREGEWAQMEAAWRAGKALYLSGPPGVGKTRLMLEFARSKGPFLLLEGRPSDSGIPYAFYTRAIRQVLALLPGLELPPWVRRELSRLLPELSDEPPPPITSEDGKVRLLEAITEVIRLLARQGRRIIVADDLQLVSDTASNEVSAYSMARLLPERQSYPITAFRREELSPPILQAILEQVERGQAVLIEVQPLSQAATQALIQSLSQTQAPLFSRRLYQATGGNPLFVLETLRSLFASGELRVESGTWVTPYDQETQNYSELPLPPSVREAVGHRVDRLGGGVRRFLEAASLAGAGFSLEQLTGATALSEWEELQAIETAEKTGLLRREGNSYSFSHDLVRRALSDGLSPERQRLLHRKLAANLVHLASPPGRIAEHLELAGRPKEAVVWRIEAAEAAARVYAHREAMAQYAQALADGADQQQAFAIHAARAGLWKILDEQAPWAAELEAMQQLATRLGGEQRAQATLAEAEFNIAAGYYSAALSQIQGLTGELPASLSALAQHITGEALVRLGRLAEAEPHLRLALEQSSEPERLGYLNNLLHVCAMQRGDFQSASLYNSAALEAYSQSGNRFGLTQAKARAGLLTGLSGDSAGAIQALEEALKEAREIGAITIQRQILVNLFKFSFESGQLEVAQTRLEEGLGLARQPQDPNLEGIFLNNLGTVYRAQGNLGQAIRAIQGALEIAERIGSTPQSLRRRIGLAENWLDLGNMEGARALLSEAQSLMEQTGLGETRPWLEGNLARYELLLGQPGAALERIERLNPDLFSDPHDLARVNWVKGLALLALDQPKQALEHALKPLPPNPNFQARALALRLLAQSQLGQKPDTALARALLAAAHPLEGLELRLALIRVHPAKPSKPRRELKQQTQQLLNDLAQSLNNYPELKQQFLRRYAS